MLIQTDINDGCAVLSMTTTALAGESFAAAFADFDSHLLRWAAAQGNAASGLSIRIATSEERVTEGARAFADIVASSPQCGSVLGSLNDVCLVFCADDGRELGRVRLTACDEGLSLAVEFAHIALADGGELRVALGPVLVEGSRVARVIAHMFAGKVLALWPEIWTGSNWINEAAAVPTLEICIGSPAISFNEAFCGRGVSIRAWPAGYLPKAGILLASMP